MKIVKKRIILGIGILILLLALAGTVSAKSGYSGADCGYCHKAIVDGDYSLTTHGSYFRDVHKFDGEKVPSNANSCLTCHPNLISFLPLTSVGSNYSKTHRYNATTLAAKMLPVPGCTNCHVNVIGNNFSLLTGTPTYLTSTTCQACHKAKYDIWSNTLHRVMLTPASKAQAMNLPTPEVGWAGISYVIVTKFQFAYINTTGYFLAKNDEYDTENKTFVDSSHKGGAYGTCGRCHTTGWNASARNSSLPGFSGTLAEPGIACERCHGAGGNGHQVKVNYSGDQCRECHTGGNHGTGWELGAHAPPPYEIGTSCMFCHSSFDQYKNQAATKANATGVSCGVCHNIHDMTDSKYAATFSQGIFNATAWSDVADSKLAFFNATASLAAGTDVFDDLSSINLLYPGIDSSRKDASYGTAPINVTGRPVSEKLCSTCHYRHGIAHTAGVNLTHSRMNYPQENWATCTDCHMGGTNAIVGKDMMKKHANDPLTENSCGGTTKCHTTSAQNLSKSSHSVVPIIREWKGSAHNDKEVNVGQTDTYNHFFGNLNATTGVASSRPNSCLKCHSPGNWDPVTPESVTTSIPLTDSFKGITCAVCHNLHDMGDWLSKTKAMFGVSKAYAWYNKDAIVAATNATTGLPSRYKANYTIQESTTELCGNCHSNIRYGNTGPGWASATAANPIGIHGFPAKDMFVGSWKESSLLKFECKDCHMATKVTDSNGNILPDSQKVKGHSFKVNATLLQSSTACSSCHVAITASATSASKPGNLTVLFTPIGNVSQTIEGIQAKTQAKWNTTNTIVTDALNNVKVYAGEKNTSRTKIAQAYWNLRFVYSDESWGVHNPTKANQLLDEAVTLANQAIAALPPVTHGNTTIGMYQNSTGTFSLKNSNTGGAADITVVYSPVNSTDIPLVGDWDGSGNDTIGIYSNGTFNLKYKNSAGKADVSFRYGDAGDIPLVGDWNGDGIDTVGIYRNGAFYLRNVNTAGIADIAFGYGITGDTPLVGDWNHDGKDTVGVYRNGVFYLRNNNSAGNADLAFGYGKAGDTPLVGDWNGVGTDTVGIYRSGSFYLRNSNDAGNADLQFVSEITGDTPIVGDWDGQ